jgi:4-alpha-glucanotransferase
MLVDIARVGLERVVGRDEPGHVDKVLRLGELTGAIGVGHAFILSRGVGGVESALLTKAVRHLRTGRYACHSCPCARTALVVNAVADSPPVDQRLKDLAHRHGVATEFYDWQGIHTETSEQTLQSVLGALGVDTTDLDAALDDTELASWRDVLPPTVMSRIGWTPWVPVHVPDGSGARVHVTLEDGTRREVNQVDHWVDPREVDGERIGEATFELPGDLPAGYHALVAVLDDGREVRSTLIVTPERLTLPPALDQQVWGVMTQAYQVRSEQSWGIGDLGDLAALTQWAAGLGAGFVLVNPMHAAQPKPPVEASPYLPTTRRFASPLYLGIEDTAEYAAAPADVRTQVHDLGAAARETNHDDSLDRDLALQAKLDAARLLFEQMLPGDDFRDWASRQGEGLTKFAVWCVAAEEFGDEDAWPSGLAQADGQAIEAFRVEHAARVEFHEWLQFLLDRQFEAVQGTARASGMALGVIHDLAVGVHPTGADAWSLRHAIAQGISVGAPPDQFNQLGQNWSQPPWHPRGLAQVGYAPYRDMVRNLLAHAGGLRIDHVIGLFRLWWIPDGLGAGEGAYVRYDHEAMLGILVLEASRAGAVIIGEDLGVVEPSVRDVLTSRGILGTSILFFEWADGQPLPPESYRELCLSSVTTHDLPPTAGYIEMAHVELRERLGLLTRSVDEERAAENESLDKIRAALASRGLLSADAGVEEQVVALHAWLGRTPSKLLGVALADLVGDRRIINQPGTNDEYPNWRLPLTGPDGAVLTFDDIVESPLPGRIIAGLDS